ncbi:MAG: 3-phosphoshikimate 1-carboxyvinyltransferase, partial [Candidatus Gracilibacteria bacterium]|nr:3-phosphoshikimate 1-carboxyvinyltransferase [Candidatus Gracilibacteria bacterium]
MQTLTLPGSKSITNRDLILASFCEGKTILKGCLESKDTKYMIEALREFGIEIKDLGSYTLEINGGIDKLKTPEKSIFLGQSGTCLRFLLGVAILVCDEEITFTGEHRLLERPLKDLFDGIEQLGINVDYKPGEY